MPKILLSALLAIAAGAVACAGQHGAVDPPSPPSINRPPLSVEPYNPGDKALFPVSSVVLSGQHDAVLVDAQLARSDAMKLVAKITASGRKLTTIYVSHGDPDYYFGLDVLQDAFPDAKIVATRSTVDHIRATHEKKFAYWGPILKQDAPLRIVIPTVLEGTSIDLEGRKLEVFGLDSAAPERTCLWIPSLRAIVGGVVIFEGLHVWMTDTEAPGARARWVALLDRIERLAPVIVIPGHYKEGSKLDVGAVRFTRDYIRAFDEEVPKAASSAELMAAMERRYPDAGLRTSLEFSSKVAKHEMTWE